MREEWFETFQTRANFKAIDNILSVKQLYEIFIWSDLPIHLSVLKTLFIRINIYNHHHFSSSFSSSSLSFYPSSSFMLPMPADNKAAVGSFVSITWPFAMSANWGSILFLINLSLSNNFLYSSSEINLFVSKTPYGTTNGLNYEKKITRILFCLVVFHHISPRLEMDRKVQKCSCQCSSWQFWPCWLSHHPKTQKQFSMKLKHLKER